MNPVRDKTLGMSADSSASRVSNGMEVLMITGDKNFVTSTRYALQAAQVEKLDVIYWGRGSLWPAIPPGPYDVVTSQDPFWRGLFAWYFARRLGARLNIQVHTDLQAQSFTRHILAQMVLRHADSIRVVSEKIQRQIERIGVRAPISVLPIFVDIARVASAAKTPRSQTQPRVLLWIGRFEREKDPLFALSVLEAVRAAGIEARLIMLGSGSLENELRQRAGKLPVEFPGWKDPAPYLAIADVVISTSLHESYGASIIEALAAGVPVVAPDVGVAKEAGAVVVPREKMKDAVIDALRSGARGELQLSLPNASEWATRWRATL